MISTRTTQQGAFVRGDEIILRVGGQHKEEILMPVRRLGVPGVHNVYNSLAATLAARALEVRNEDIRDALHSFSGVEHRLEYVRTVRGAKYYNDSKATNINAAWYALSSFDHPIVWIAGGRGDKNAYSELDELVGTNVHAIVCIGEDADAIFNHWCTTKRCVKVASLDEAVRVAQDLSEPDDIVLFSPACKSFDMFDNFEQRGSAFKSLVKQL
jgi:UDP-N-acetylmuramoylalanine--D-glutamate ligase